MGREQVSRLSRRYDVERAVGISEIVEAAIARAVNRGIRTVAAHGMIGPEQREGAAVHFDVPIEPTADYWKVAEGFGRVCCPVGVTPTPAGWAGAVRCTQFGHRVVQCQLDARGAVLDVGDSPVVAPAGLPVDIIEHA